jgi:selenium metabolism protein YedF
MKKLVDVRKLSCPQPVLLTKKALEEGNFSVLEILGDNEAAKENITSLLQKMNFQILSVSQENETFHIFVNGDEKQEHPDFTDAVLPEMEKKIILITSDKLGDGDDDLGTMLMKAFTFTLTELKEKPATLICMNFGVKLCIEGAETLPNLKKLAENGVEILVCGTCLNYYQLKDKLKVGKVSNMYEISERLFGSLSVVSI